MNALRSPNKKNTALKSLYRKAGIATLLIIAAALIGLALCDWFIASQTSQPSPLTAQPSVAANQLDNASILPIYPLSRYLLVGFSLTGLAFIFQRLIKTEIEKPLNALAESSNALANQQSDVRITELTGSPFAEISQAMAQLQQQQHSHDVTSDALKNKETELVQANQDLHNFTYAASHDLKSPLRAILGLIHFLRDDFEGPLDPKTEQHLANIRTRVMRLESLVDNLQEYAHISRSPSVTAQIELATLFNEITQVVDPKGQFNWRLDSKLSAITVYPAPLFQVLYHLSKNAVKHHNQNTGNIVISVELLGDAYCFSVTDDGPGIPSAYHDKIFELFQTLRPKDSLEGSGMGLAIVAKIIRSYGGSIWVESSPEKQPGSRFSFRWPAEHSQQV